MYTQQKYLAFLGLFPFIVLSLLLFSGNQLLSSISTSELLKSYTILIGSFMAGCHWGMLLPNNIQLKPKIKPHFINHLPIISNAITLIFWFAYFLVSDFLFFAISALGFTVLLFLDKQLNKHAHITDAYFKLRLTISVKVIICLMLAAVAVVTKPSL